MDWSAPGAEELAAGVYRIPVPLPMDGLRAANVYAVVDAGRVALIDAGWAVATARDALAAALDGVGAGLDQVTDILVTHAHRDHYTLAVAIRREFGSRVALGAAERVNAEVLARRRPWGDELAQPRLLRRAGAFELAKEMERFDMPFDSGQWALPDRWLEHDSTVEVAGRTLRVLHTPGHTRGHVVYLDEADGLLFAGDHVLPHITPSLGFEQVPPPSPLADFLGSLQLLRARPDARLLPGHGPVTGSVHARVDELVAHHARRLDQTLAALRRGACTAYEVARQLRWTRHERAIADLDELNRMLAVLETAAHLDLLAERGQVWSVPGDDGAVRYATG